MRARVSTFLFAALAAFAFSISLAGAEPLALNSTRIAIYPQRPDDIHVGTLTYRGGLVLSSSNRDFGGWSDIAVNADGSEILAISDEAHWLRAHLSYDASGKLSGTSNAEIAPILNMQGRPMRGKEGDAEGLTLVKRNDVHGQVLVSFERNVRVWRYDISKGFDARPTDIPIGPWVQLLHDNKQLEAITLIKPDTLLAFAETQVNSGDDILGAFEAYPGQPGKLGTQLFTVVPQGDFAITSVAATDDGGIYLLERRFSLLGGMGMELRRIEASELHAGARIQGKVIARLAQQDSTIDNMEGLALRKGPRGETLLYMISDDNYSPLQRTLLLMFEVRN